ncbi:recombinase family protein [Burkholderia stagnalis]|uniref:recombinase family protein n=1 Tax=Burkholderia stagnalis TaxID=1503054 RepID=UPI000F57D2A7|nr:recombinase family protein [Burkholderia stagnalis]RQQ21735.1 recombinase family protein [Burkholderia stagnalis]RQQ23578.1 recombinase family protein [Burkholderia stagnalis]RQQ41741.1 recombinase family protein [Burkholderia stagnalis]RQX85486.1 recombinase family protein [Burkholderia stagnalis]RQY04853.1 recombinase family protein [Burkholderia stagnalis]
MKIGYARVSTQEQNLNLQKDALRRVGCRTIYTDQGLSGSGFSRPGLDLALKHMQAGSTLVVWRLDRLGRSLSKLVDLVAYLERRQIKLESITEAISTDSSGGLLVFHMMSALAQFERSLISERTRAGMAAARARGAKLGRKRALTPSQERQALRLLETHSVTAVADIFQIHPRTLCRIRARHRIEQP